EETQQASDLKQITRAILQPPQLQKGLMSVRELEGFDQRSKTGSVDVVHPGQIDREDRRRLLVEYRKKLVPNARRRVDGKTTTQANECVSVAAKHADAQTGCRRFCH